jgi:hypothetical protein
MKFFLLAFAATLLGINTLDAQHFNIGIKGGVNLYNIVNENSSIGEPLIGFHVGLIGHYHLNNQFAIAPEVVFSTQGTKTSNNGVESQLSLNYVNVPLLLQYMFDNGFRIFTGPQAGFLMSAKSNSNNSEVDRTNDFQALEFGGVFGASYINPESNFGFDARYNLGLTDINEVAAGSSFNRGIQVGLFYLFNHN